MYLSLVTSIFLYREFKILQEIDGFSMEYYDDRNSFPLLEIQELTSTLLDNFIEGESNVLFIYGITTSGKTYIMMGPLNNPDLIPRSFDAGFQFYWILSWEKHFLRSDRQNGYEIQSEADILLELQHREIQITKNGNYQQKSKQEIFYVKYNNYIYDLFDDDFVSKTPQSKQLRDDNRGRSYIKDVKEIEIRSSQEAIKLLNMSFKRRRTAHTQLNTESSRPHSVLSMCLVQFENDIPPTSLTKDDLIVSTIDLAGSERVNRAKAVAERVKEADNANSLLMVLRQCFETLRQNHAQGISRMVPYRESKLSSFSKITLTTEIEYK
ncbi:unnamed protein product [Adineta ricciae]|uniref:Kinesin motor domain-containing protein n=1 Tax=Adineta ricciae TaxID=249248 RepID=A0A815FJL1_ADIRI|nr:unnamed protein product [Adineta ricciae]